VVGHDEAAGERIRFGLLHGGFFGLGHVVRVAMKQKMAKLVRRGEDPSFHRDPVPRIHEHLQAGRSSEQIAVFQGGHVPRQNGKPSNPEMSSFGMEQGRCAGSTTCELS